MDDEEQRIAKSIRSGQYFQDARAWYAAAYIGLVSERSFFLIIGGLSALVGVCSIISLMSLLPLVPKPGIILTTRENAQNYVPRLVRLRERKGDVTEAIQRFFVLQYIDARESYDARKFISNAAFIRAQSSAAVYSEYYAQQKESNPQSFSATLGGTGQQYVKVTALDFDWERPPEPAAAAGQAPSAAPAKIYIANLRFITEAVVGNQSVKSQWTATLKYNYTDIAIEEEKDATIKIADPKFQVISYVVTKNAP